MSLQMFSSGEDRLYNPNRDVAHCFGWVVEEASRRLASQQWPVLADYCKAHGVTPEELAAAAASFSAAVAQAAEHPEERRPAQTLKRVGFLDVRDEAQFAYQAVLGTVCLGIFWQGVKHASVGGFNPVVNSEGLAREAGLVSAALTARRGVLSRLVRMFRRAR